MEIKVFPDKNYVTKSFRDRSGAIDNFVPLSLMNSLMNQTSTEQNDKVLIEMFNTVPELSSLAKYIAITTAAIPVKYVTYSKKGEEIDIKLPEIDNLLKNPNPFQTGVNFHRTAILQYLLFGRSYINKYIGIGNEMPSYLYLLPPEYVQILFKYMQFDKINPNVDFRINEIVNYKLKYGSSFETTIEPEEIIHFKDSQINFDNGRYAEGQSRVYSAIMATKTIKEGYEAKYSILKNRGVLGMIVNDDPDGTPLQPDEEDKMLNKFNTKFGIHENQNLIMYTNRNLKYLNVSPDFDKLKIPESNEADFMALCKAMGGFPPSLISDKRAALIRDSKEADKKLYKNIDLPIAKDYWMAYSTGLGLAEKNQWIIPDISKIEALQEDQQKKSTVNKTVTESISKILNDFNTGALSFEQALYLLTTKWDIEETEAKKLLVKPEKIEENENNQV